MKPDACARCNDAEPELGRALCKPCIKALDHPIPPPPEPSRRGGPRMHIKPIDQRK